MHMHGNCVVLRHGHPQTDRLSARLHSLSTERDRLLRGEMSRNPYEMRQRRACNETGQGQRADGERTAERTKGVAGVQVSC